MHVIRGLLVDAAVVAGLMLLLAAVFLATVTVMVRRVRRRWRSLRGAAVPRRSAPESAPESAPVLSGIDRHAVVLAAVSAAGTLSSPRWWAVQQARRRMWRSVTAARHAVTMARRAGAPVGDLPTVVRQLEVAARSADALARARAHSPGGPRPDVAEVRRVEEAAAHVHQAAVHSLRSVAAAESDSLLPAARLEAAAVAAGVRAAVAPHRPA